MSDRLEAATTAAREAGAHILQCLRRGAVISQKNEREPHNLVSDADLAAEDIIVRMLGEAFPEDAFLAEEKHRDRLDSEALWVIDPIDGTGNFAHGFPAFCTSIALAARGEFVLGVVYDPVADNLFQAVKGEGATRNGHPVHVSQAASIREALVATGFHYDRGVMLHRTLEAVEALFHAGIHGLRRTGSAALDLCYLGCGWLDAFFEFKLSPWDFAAGAVFLREAGGRATDSHGAELTVHSAEAVGSNGRIHDEFLSMVSAYRPPPGWDTPPSNGDEQ